MKMTKRPLFSRTPVFAEATTGRPILPPAFSNGLHVKSKLLAIVSRGASRKQIPVRNPKPSRGFCALALVLCLSLVALLTGSPLCAEDRPVLKPLASKALPSVPRDPVLRLKLLPPGPDNPRNSEAAFLRLKDGRILMVYSHFTGKQGADESPCHLTGRYSSDGGKTWTKDDVRIVSGDEAKTHNVMSPSLLRLQAGRIALFYLRLNGPLDDRPIMRVSTDEAQTWSEPRVCISDDEVGLYILSSHRSPPVRSMLPLTLENWGKSPLG